MAKNIGINDTNSMKGVAIIFIILHNLIHLIVPIKENEYSFRIEHSEMFISNLLNFQDGLWKEVFSFLGWYGIFIYLFISGYGLVKKYENEKYRKISFWPFVLNHAKKLFLLMIIPYITYLLLLYVFSGQLMGLDAIFAQTLMISNLYSFYIHPGVYWYFGLMLQLYVIYYLFIFRKRQLNIGLLIILQFVVIIFTYCVLDKSSVLDECLSLKYALSSYNLLHNSIGWFLPFTFGVVYARRNLNIVFKNRLTNGILFIISSALLIFSNLNFFTWLISPIFAIISAIYLNELIKTFKFTTKIFIYIGGLSAFIFATHPLIRYIYLQITSSLDVLYVVLYAMVCIIVAFCYKKLHNLLFKS